MKKALRETKTLRALAVRFGHARLPARHKHKHTDRTDYNTLRRSLARSVINRHARFLPVERETEDCPSKSREKSLRCTILT